METFKLYVGIDEADAEHEVAVVDSSGEVVLQGLRIAHSAEGQDKLVRELDRLSDGDRTVVAIALERPHGAVVDCLLDSGFAVHSINPKQVDRFRDRHTSAGAKDDRLDAFVQADSLRTDRKLFRRLKAGDPLVIRIRDLARVRKGIQEDLIALTNQLRSELHRYFPQFLQLSNGVNEAWIWDLVEAVMTPGRAKSVRPSKIQRILDRHRITRVDGRDVLKVLRTRPLRVNQGVVDSATFHIELLLPRLRATHEQLRISDRKLDSLVRRFENEEDTEGNKKHRDVEILRSFPGIGRVVIATMLGEVSDDLAERNYNRLRVIGGVAPVTKRSGKMLQVVRRYARNRRLEDAFHHWARVAVQHDAYARMLYQKGRERGQTNARALRGVADRLLKALMAALRNGELYDPARLQEPASKAA